MTKKIGLVMAMFGMGILAVTILAGCNTVKGVGADIGAGGNAIERSSGK